MWRCKVLFPQLGALCHTEAVLLVDDNKTKVAELHIVLYHGMRAYEYLHLSRLQTVHHGLAALALYHTRQQFHTHRHRAQHLLECGKVLLGKYLCWCHNASLESVVQGYEHGHQCHHGFARSHIALYQAVHLPSRLHVGMHLPDDSFLSASQLEGKVVGIESIEMISHPIEHMSAYGALTQTCIAEDGKLHIE